MKLVFVSDHYVVEIQKICPKVPNLYSANWEYRKPYLGPVLAVGELHYFAPLSSLDHTMKSPNIEIQYLTDRECLLEHHKARLGFVKLQYMIPVPIGAVEDFPLRNFTGPYRELLNNQTPSH